ncbi:PQQ-binding-like beta-propeller repeat protein [Streptomyces sp. NRRL B-1347]|uniref:outer membrane protein assembly factor BamB family protein n=1 Tax=Streptomyces sp. NRRL B-1347 TaxID=1476877 RepID=UPI0004C967E2|nr:PQQ-binding-like beta-propeller repeat protein [Streptomyces sp. NRRL B-1347]
MLLRGWVDEARLGVEGLRGKLTPEHFASGRVPAKATLSTWLSGKGLRWEFVEAVADACSTSHAALESRLAQARPLWQRYQRSPSPAAGGPEPAGAGRDELLRAQRRIIELQEQLARAHHAYGHSQQALACAVPLAVLLSQMVGRLTAQIDSLRARPAADPGDLELARDQLHHAETELAQAKAQRDEAERLAQAAEHRVEEVKQQLRVLRALPTSSRPAPGGAAPVVRVGAPDAFLSDVGRALEKARTVNVFTQTLTQAAREELAPSSRPAVPDNADNPVTSQEPVNNLPPGGRAAALAAAVALGKHHIPARLRGQGQRRSGPRLPGAVRLRLALAAALLVAGTLVLDGDGFNDRAAQGWPLPTVSSSGDKQPGPTVSEGLVYVGTTDAVEAVSADTGKRRWRYASRIRSGWRDMARQGRAMYINDAQGHIDALDMLTGTRRWRAAVPRGEYPPRIVLHSDTLYVAHPDGLTALDARTGARR